MIEYNTCKTCGANGGRAGILFNTAQSTNECANCYDTRRTGNIVVYSHLNRTPEELKKTFNILG